MTSIAVKCCRSAFFKKEKQSVLHYQDPLQESQERFFEIKFSKRKVTLKESSLLSTYM